VVVVLSAWFVVVDCGYGSWWLVAVVVRGGLQWQVHSGGSQWLVHSGSLRWGFVVAGSWW